MWQLSCSRSPLESELRMPMVMLQFVASGLAILADVSEDNLLPSPLCAGTHVTSCLPGLALSRRPILRCSAATAHLTASQSRVAP